MNAVRLIRTLAAASAALVLGSLANADTFTSNVTTNPGDWSSTSIWLQNGSAATRVPGSGDTVTIVSGDVVEVTSNQEVTALTVATGGVLKIDGPGSMVELAFPNAGNPSLSIADANGFILVDNARLRVAKTMSIATSASGTLQGQDNAAEIAIDTDDTTAVTLTVAVPVHGKLTFKKHDAGSAAATLVNSGGIDADVSGTITFGTGLTLSGSGAWTASASGASMVFNTAASNLSGAFTVGGSANITFNVASTSLTSNFILQSNGQFKFTASLTTSGTLSIACGSITREIAIENSAVFTYGSVASENCNPDPPATQISAHFNCA